MIANSVKVALLAVAVVAVAATSADAGHRRSSCNSGCYTTSRTTCHKVRYRACRPKRHHRVKVCYQPCQTYTVACQSSSCGSCNSHKACGTHKACRTYSHCGSCGSYSACGGSYSACGSCGSYSACPSGACGTSGYSPAPQAPVEDAPEPPAEPEAAPEPDAAPAPEAAPAPAA